MPPKSDSVESIVLNYINERLQNRPLNSQNVADALQKFNLKKTAVQKTLDTLADNGQISFKEYGKQKIYIARQDQFDIPDNEELGRMKAENSKLQQELEDQKKAIGQVEGDWYYKIRALQSNLTLEQVQEMEEKLRKLQEGTILVKPEDRKTIEDKYLEKINHWRKRKRIFKDLWDSITENSPKDVKEFKEELGIEYDEDLGVSFQSCSEITPIGKKRKIGN
ncbi:Homologous-pairing protein 2 [Asimina triloba]